MAEKREVHHGACLVCVTDQSLCDSCVYTNYSINSRRHSLRAKKQWVQPLFDEIDHLKQRNVELIDAVNDLKKLLYRAEKQMEATNRDLEEICAVKLEIKKIKQAQEEADNGT